MNQHQQHGRGASIGPPELDLLLHAAVFDLFPDSEGAFRRLLDGPMDWRQVMRLAVWHRLTPLLAARLREPDLAEKVPSEVLERLRHLHQRSAIFQQVRRWELAKVLAAFDEVGIEAILLKGVALAETIYPSPAMRPMKDVDLLLKEDDLDRAESLILEFGYVQPDYTPEVVRSSRKHHRHIPELWRPDGSVCFELHRHIVLASSPLHFDISAFRSRAMQVSVGDLEALVLAPEDLLIHLCLNVFQDLARLYPSDAVLGKLLDIVRTLRAGIDVGSFTQRTMEYGIERPVVCVLSVVRRLFPPEAVLEVLCEDLGASAIQESDLESLIARRFLRSPKDAWFFHALIVWPDSVTLASEFKSGLRRILASRIELASLYGAKPFHKLLGRHVKEASRALADLLLRPAEVRKNIQVDRWLYTRTMPLPPGSS